MDGVQTPQQGQAPPPAQARPPIGKRRQGNPVARYGCMGLLGFFFLFCLMCNGLLAVMYLGGGPGLFVGANILAFMTAIPYGLMLLWLDRNEQEPIYLIATALIWGAMVSTVVSMIFNDSFAGITTAVIGDYMIAQALTASISAPFIEELSKGFGVLLIFLLFKDEFDNILDGILYGALVGLGFATVENVIYYYDIGMHEGAAGMLKLTWVRGLLGGIGSHAAYTAITGMGFGVVRVLRAGFARWLLVPLFWGTAMFAHFAWNTFVGFFVFSDDELMIYAVSIPIAILVLEMPFMLLIGLVVGVVWRGENKVILQYLSDEPDDILTDEFRRGMVPARRRVLSGLKRFFSMGPSRWWHHRKLDHDLIELAFAKWHLDKDPDTDWAPDEDDAVMKLRAAIRQRRRKIG